MKKTILGAITLSLLALMCPGTRAAAPAKPNVVLILADDLGWTDLSCQGSKYYQTPHIDALAKRGMRFTQAYSANPLCSPTRASIITGLWPSRIGLTTPSCHIPEVILKQELLPEAPPDQKVLSANSVTRLDTSYPGIAKCFKNAGYATGHIGKWHLGKEPYSPLQHGFDEDIPHSPNPSPMGNGWFFPWPSYPKQGKPGDHLEERMAEEAVGFIRRHAKEPFYLQYWMWEVHSPFGAREELIEKYEKLADPKSKQRNPVYAAMVEHMDQAVGKVVAELERQNLMDNTIIIFTSDNGPIVQPFTYKKYMPLPYREIPVSSASPLKGGKSSLWEGGTRVPLIVNWPGVTRHGSTNSQAIVQSIDFFPTLAEICGLDRNGFGPLDGESFVPALRGDAFERDAIFCHFPTGTSPGSYVRKGDWKLIRMYCGNPDRSDSLQLYNLADDIGETRDVSKENPEITTRLNALIDEWLKKSGAVIPIPNPNSTLK